jgi:lysozyme family protein
METNYKAALDHILKSEGGFQDDPRDNGNKLPDGRKGCTNLGVTQAVWEAYVGHKVSTADMKALTPEKVAPFYKHKYWDAVYGDDLPSGIDYLAFDFAINAGAGRAIKTLQTAVGVTADGAIGPKTLQAVKAASGKELINKYTQAKEAFYRGLPSFPIYGKGWLARTNAVDITAKTLIG